MNQIAAAAGGFANIAAAAVAGLGSAKGGMHFLLAAAVAAASPGRPWAAAETDYKLHVEAVQDFRI